MGDTADNPTSMTVIKWKQNFGYSEDGYYRIEKWGGADTGYSFALSTKDVNYLKVCGPFLTKEIRDEEIQDAIAKHDATAYNGT